MASYQDLIVSRRERVNAVAAMQEALCVMDGIMQHPLVTDLIGDAYSSCDVDKLAAGSKALKRWVAEPQTQEQRVLNETCLEQGGRAVSLAQLMLRRMGFADIRSPGDDVDDGHAFSDSQQRVIERAWEKYQEITGYCRN